MKVLESFKNWFNSSDENFTEAEDNYEDDFDFRPGEEEEKEPQPAPKVTSRQKAEKNNVVSFNTPKPVGAVKPRVVFQKIDRFEEVNKVADILKEKRIVVLNLETCPNDVSQRIIDVLYGVSYANDGEFKKIASRAYVITPDGVPVTGELSDKILEEASEDMEF